MKGVSLSFLRIVILFIGIGAFVFLLWEPHVEGRNVNATLFEIYFKDPFLACAYASSTLFFASLYQAFKLLGYAERNELFSQSSLRALRMIRWCATTLVALLLVAETYLFTVLRSKDDIAGGVAMGLFLMIIFSLVALFAFRFEKHIRKRS